MKRSLSVFVGILTAALLIGCSSEAPTSVATLDNNAIAKEQSRTTTIQYQSLFEEEFDDTISHIMEECNPFFIFVDTPEEIFQTLVDENEYLRNFSWDNASDTHTSFNTNYPFSCFNTVRTYINENMRTFLRYQYPNNSNMFNHFYDDQTYTTYDVTTLESLKALYDCVENISNEADINEYIDGVVGTYEENQYCNTKVLYPAAEIMRNMLNYFLNKDNINNFVKNMHNGVLHNDFYSNSPQELTQKHTCYFAKFNARFAFCAAIRSYDGTIFSISDWENETGESAEIDELDIFCTAGISDACNSGFMAAMYLASDYRW